MQQEDAKFVGRQNVFALASSCLLCLALIDASTVVGLGDAIS